MNVVVNEKRGSGGAATRWQHWRSGFVSKRRKKRKVKVEQISHDLGAEGYTRGESYGLNLMCCESGGHSRLRCASQLRLRVETLPHKTCLYQKQFVQPALSRHRHPPTPSHSAASFAPWARLWGQNKGEGSGIHGLLPSKFLGSMDQEFVIPVKLTTLRFIDAAEKNF